MSAILFVSICYAGFMVLSDWNAAYFKMGSLMFWGAFRFGECYLTTNMLIALNPYPKKMLQSLFYGREVTKTKSSKHSL